ncbi:cytochrome P450 4B1-like isoform X1, partial [Podarcis lilfordi]
KRDLVRGLQRAPAVLMSDNGGCMFATEAVGRRSIHMSQKGLKKPEGRRFHRNLPLGKRYRRCQLQKPVSGGRPRRRRWMHCIRTRPGHSLSCLPKLHKMLTQLGYKQGDADKCLYSKSNNGQFSYILAFVDDLIIATATKRWSQRQKIHELVEHMQMQDAHPVATPMATDFLKNQQDSKQLPDNNDYRSAIGVKRVVRYLKGTMNCKLSCLKLTQTSRENSYIQTVFDLGFLVYQRLKTPLHHNDLIYWLSSKGRQFYKACKIAHHHTEKVIRERKDSSRMRKELEKILKKRHLDFLDILLCAKDENGNPLSDEDIRAEVDTFMFEGHDTTASGISWLFYCMGPEP